jgi:hypothetical protein
MIVIKIIGISITLLVWVVFLKWASNNWKQSNKKEEVES